jgi:hypothetical protein
VLEEVFTGLLVAVVLFVASLSAYAAYRLDRGRA